MGDKLNLIGIRLYPDRLPEIKPNLAYERTPVYIPVWFRGPDRYRDGLFSRVDLNLLKTFFFIVENRSFSKAAADLGISQPSVSAALCRLEEALGSQLIVRSTHRFDITAGLRTQVNDL